MSLKKQIEEKLNEALKAKDKNMYPTLRLVLSAIKDAEIASRTKGQKEMSDSELTAILKRMIKQRNESCEVYKKAGRNELLENETKEIEVISEMKKKNLNGFLIMSKLVCLCNISHLVLFLLSTKSDGKRSGCFSITKHCFYVALLKSFRLIVKCIIFSRL